MRSWRTTLFGALGIVAGCVVVSDFSPTITKLAGCLASIANGLGLFFARDSAVSKRMAQRNGPMSYLK